ncbi:pentapeptide repeat-containing protein [Listeria monocytogenes]|nr:pentapeptide repeat-containing protein [Listeria monocytogenes]
MNQAELDVVIEKHEKWLRDGYGERADLRGANLRHADLRRADLSYANLSYADLRRADLSYANLSYADLSYANLRRADLSYADLNWINWRDVVGLTVIAVQINTTRKNNQITYIKELEIWTTGCFQGTLEELKTSIENTHKDNEKLKAKYYRVIDFILQEAE